MPITIFCFLVISYQWHALSEFVSISISPEVMIHLLLWFSFSVWFRLGIRKENLAKYEEEVELKIAKEQLTELKKDALEAMETQLKRYLCLTSQIMKKNVEKKGDKTLTRYPMLKQLISDHYFISSMCISATNFY